MSGYSWALLPHSGHEDRLGGVLGSAVMRIVLFGFSRSFAQRPEFDVHFVEALAAYREQ